VTSKTQVQELFVLIVLFLENLLLLCKIPRNLFDEQLQAGLLLGWPGVDAVATNSV
jgi:hypothetical protein